MVKQETSKAAGGSPNKKDVPRTVTINPNEVVIENMGPSSNTSKKRQTHVKNKLSGAVPTILAAEPNGLYPDRIRLGICAMDKKARSKPMAEILSRLDESLFHVIFFGDDLILNKPIEEWPDCEVVIAFFSKGYPLAKAKDYVDLKKPFILNDLEMQETLKDRRKVYDLLEASGIDVPRHAYVSLDDYVSTGTGDGNKAREREVQEFDDHIEVNGISIDKPFLEKPVDADDHNIAIYVSLCWLKISCIFSLFATTCMNLT
jgi:inositol hexakisphosphate/diphosphoinositol-pentakisphosphate kinase